MWSCEPQPQARRVCECGRASRSRRRGESINMVRVKVCGITRLEDAMTAVEAGARAPRLLFLAEEPALVSPGPGAPPADRVDGRARTGQPAVADHPLRRPHARERGPRRRDGAPVRGRRQLGRRGRARAQGPGQGVAIRRRGEGGPMTALPDREGRFGRFGGRFVPETLMAPLLELERAYRAARRDPTWRRRFAELLADYAGRPTPLYFARRLTEHWRGARTYPKREAPCHPAAPKINNRLGQ